MQVQRSRCEAKMSVFQIMVKRVGCPYLECGCDGLCIDRLPIGYKPVRASSTCCNFGVERVVQLQRASF